MKVKCKKCKSKCISTKLISKDSEINTKYSYKKPMLDTYEDWYATLNNESSYYVVGTYTYVDLLRRECNICSYEWFELTKDQIKSKKEILTEIKGVNSKAEKELVKLNIVYEDYQKSKVKEKEK